jgi:membrane-associated phospholipid phosphatase
VNDRAHFPSDVVAGALIGRAVAKGVTWRHRGHKTAWHATPILGPHEAGLTMSLAGSS